MIVLISATDNILDTFQHLAEVTCQQTVMMSTKPPMMSISPPST